MGWEALKTAGTIAGGAAAIYSLARALLVPLLRQLADSVGGWRGKLLKALLWAFDRPEAEIAKAEAAGAAAVEGNPGSGAAGATGEPRDIA